VHGDGHAQYWAHLRQLDTEHKGGEHVRELHIHYAKLQRHAGRTFQVARAIALPWGRLSPASLTLNRLSSDSPRVRSMLCPPLAGA
jgi:hypothetical protein